MSGFSGGKSVKIAFFNQQIKFTGGFKKIE
jgi:hypothetical protein